MNEKEKRLATWCRENGYEGVLLRRRTNIAWLTDGADVHVDSASSTGVASLLWTPRKKVVFTTNIEARRLADEEFDAGWEIREARWWEKAKPPKGRFAADLPDDPFADLRSPLTPLEAKRIRELGEAASAELARVMKALRRGWTEHQAAGELAGRLRKAGILPGVLLVAADERIARYRHPIPTSKRIDRTVMVAVCPRLHGLTIAVTRLAHFARRLPSDLRRKHDAVCRVDEALHAATVPGAAWCDVLAEGIRVYRETGFADEWKKHHQGGPMGYEGRDFKATPNETRTVLVGQAVGWNPSITGTKSEDTILVGPASRERVKPPAGRVPRTKTGPQNEVITASRDWPKCGTRPDILCRG